MSRAETATGFATGLTEMASASRFARGVDHCLSLLCLGRVTDKALTLPGALEAAETALPGATFERGNSGDSASSLLRTTRGASGLMLGKREGRGGRASHLPVSFVDML